MNTESTCPSCGAPISEEAPRGLCPRCLMDAAFASEPKARAAIPTVKELASVFPQLEVLELLGSGGMGRVYKARQTHLDRLVALKVLPPELASDPAFAERFAREARALAKLNHPNIVQCFDFGQSTPKEGSQSYFYLLLEYVDGVNLRQTMQAGTLTAREALGIVPFLCDALNYAHEQGVLHRDIKPENILVDKRGRVKIADFGLARFHKEDDTQAMTLTASGAQLGTAAYMAPEQIEQPHDVDHRADIYSLGVVFYEMLTGELPLGRFAAPSETRGVDPRLDSVVFRTLEKQADRRYQSAGEVQTQVETIAGTPTPNADAAFSSVEHNENPNALKTGEALAFPPSWMTTWNWLWRQPFLFQRGTLTLDPHQLTYSSSKATLSIPLESIEQVTLGPLSFIREPLGRCPIMLRWKDAAGRVQNTSLLVGSSSWLQLLTEEQSVTDAWTNALYQARSERVGGSIPTPSLCADVTPAAPEIHVWVWIIAGILASILALSLNATGNVLLGLPLTFIIAAVGFGVWRRRPGPDPHSKLSEPGTPPPTAAPSSPISEPETDPKPVKPNPLWQKTKGAAAKAKGFAASKLSSSPKEGNDHPPRSKLAVWAFGFSTIGWVTLFIGPIIGCVLGWIALSRIKKSDAPLQGRGLALFAALQAPVILVGGALGGSLIALGDSQMVRMPYPIAILILAGLVFICLRVIFRMAGFRGLWSWRKKAGVAALLLATLLLAGTTWALQDLNDKWPFRGSLVEGSFHGSESGRWNRLLAQDLRDQENANLLHITERPRVVRASIAVEHPDEIAFSEGMLSDIGQTLTRRHQGTRFRISINDAHREWNLDRGHSEELWITFAAIGCGAGLLFAFSGFASGSIAFLVTIATCLSLFDARLPTPFGHRLQDLTAIMHQSSPDRFPTHIDGIRLQ